MLTKEIKQEVSEIAAKARSQGWEIGQASKWLFDQKKKLVEYAIVFVKIENGERKTLRKKLSWDLSSQPHDKEETRSGKLPVPSSDQSF